MPIDRLVALEGCLNFRDLGGYACREGRTVRCGQVFRSDSLHELTGADVATIGSLGVRSVYDLRAAHERAARPGVVESTHLGLAGDPGMPLGPTLLEQVRAGTLPRRDDAMMVRRYLEVFEQSRLMFGRLLLLLAVDGALPAVFHCAAGKDRTGMAAALLLSVLGVDRASVLDDYDLTNGCRTERYLDRIRPEFEAAGLDVEAVRWLVRARREVLEGALAGLDERYGSVEAYVIARTGVDEDGLVRLRQLLLE